MRLRKLFLTFLLAAILMVQCICLGWAAIEGERTNIGVHTLHIVFALYALVAAARSVGQQDNEHAVSMIHLSALTFVASAFLFTTSILPSTELVDISLYVPSTVPLVLFYATLALYVASLVLAASTPCGPPLHFPPEQIYSDKVTAKMTNTSEDNVCGITGASVWDTLLFSYTTKVVMLGNTAESLETGDLPIVPAVMRATTIFRNMRGALKEYHLRVRSWRPRPGTGWELGYRLLRVNLWNVTTVVILAMLVAGLFYAPHYFLRRVVRYLEMDPERKDRSWGWAYCCGLFFANALTQLLMNQILSLSTMRLQVSLKVQLNSILYAKTLVRKDIASSGGPAPESATAENGAAASANTEIGESKSDEDDFSSKAQIMTLMTTDVDRVSEFARYLITLFGM